MLRMVLPSKPILPMHPLPLPPSLTKRPVVLVFLVLLLLRSRALTLSKDGLASLRRGTPYLTNFQRRQKLTTEELAKVLQQVYIDEPDGSQTLLVPYRERVVKVRDLIRTNLSTSRRIPILLKSNYIHPRFPFTQLPNPDFWPINRISHSSHRKRQTNPTSMSLFSPSYAPLYSVSPFRRGTLRKRVLSFSIPPSSCWEHC